MWKMKTITLLGMALLLALSVSAAAAQTKASIKFPAKVGLMLEGETATLKPKMNKIALSELSWTSSDDGVVLMNGNVASAVKPGKAIITATGGGAKAQCGVVVLPTAVTLAVGETARLPRGGVERYSVRDKKIATVTKKGVVKGKKPGETKVEARYGKQKRTVRVVVTANDAPQPQQGSAVASLDCANETDQIVLVEYTGGSSAVLSIHERLDGVWTELFSCDANVGKNGIGKTKEGDKRTPSGTYNLTTPFGIKDDPGAKMPYTKVTKYHYWCGTSGSEYYNQLVDERKVSRKHTASDEYLIEYKGVYNYCLFIDYNAAGEPGRGSCIFLHCAGKNGYTAGCVAVPEKAMKQIICWARDGVKIVIRDKQTADN